jgi:5-methylcytosine-specific restriction endonuclease McrA
MCGKKLGTPTNKTCNSPKCINAYTVKNYGELSHQPYYRNKIIKKYYIQTRGHKCEMCGTTTWLGKQVPLVAHHINGDANDWRPENVQLLCGNCHPFTPNYCGKNGGNGTRFRRYNIL